MIIQEQNFSIAIQTVLHRHRNKFVGVLLTEGDIQSIANEIMVLSRQFQKSYIACLPVVEPLEISLSEALTVKEQSMFSFYAKIKGISPEELLRTCVMLYCPLDIMIQQAEDGEP